VATRLRFAHTPLKKQTDYIDAFLNARAVTDYFSGFFNQTDPDLPKSAFAYSLFYVYFDQYQYIRLSLAHFCLMFCRGLAVQNVILAVGVVFLAILFVRNMEAALLVSICVLGTSLNLIGVVWLLNVIMGGYVVLIQPLHHKLA
jgi:hypothetical protein